MLKKSLDVKSFDALEDYHRLTSYVLNAYFFLAKIVVKTMLIDATKN